MSTSSRLVQFGERAEIRPAIAERWEISPDGRIYTFTPRAARFHNGRRVRADDVKYLRATDAAERSRRRRVFRPLVGLSNLGCQRIVAGTISQASRWSSLS